MACAPGGERRIQRPRGRPGGGREQTSHPQPVRSSSPRHSPPPADRYNHSNYPHPHYGRRVRPRTPCALHSRQAGEQDPQVSARGGSYPPRGGCQVPHRGVWRVALQYRRQVRRVHHGPEGGQRYGGL
eukprot:scaffold1297_cov368-Prasinococcus_capsulatus_cf.AAC.6